MTQSLCLLVLLCLCSVAWGAGRIFDHPQFVQLRARSNGAAQLREGPNGAVFLTFPRDSAVAVESLVPRVATAAAAATQSQADSLRQLSLSFVQEFHALWGFESAAQAREQLQVKSVQADTQVQGHSHVLMEQRFRGVRVFGGDVRVHYSGASKLHAANGLIVNNINDKTVHSTVPSISLEEASSRAVQFVLRRLSAKSFPNTMLETLSARKASADNLLIFRKDVLSLLAKDATPHLVWEVEVFSEPLAIRDQVMVDAHTGHVVNHISLMKNALNRRVFFEEYLPNTIVWEEGKPIPANDTDLVNVLKGAEAFYDLFSKGFGYKSFDGNDATIDSVYRIRDPTRCPNAWWDGVKCSYCVGVTALDIGVHELAHAVTTHTDDLYYEYQSGALNEAYSDIFGETADILQGDPLKQNPRTAGSCSVYGEGSPANDESKRWLIGDTIAPEVLNQTGIRDMWRPECYYNPGSVEKGIFWCYEGDNGGVHFNSGVINHAYALAVDGGSFGGKTITGIGLNRALAVWWRAKTVYQSRTTNFVDHAHALRQACSDLTDQAVKNLTTGEEAETITEADCDQISAAIDAVKMTADIVSICDLVRFENTTTDPSMCINGENGTILLEEQFLSNPASRAWSIYQFNTSFGLYWQHDCTPNRCLMWAPSQSYNYCVNEALNILESPNITAPTNGSLLLTFSFLIETASSENGGVVIAWVNDVKRVFEASDFLYNGYNGVINNPLNQLHGKSAWTGSHAASAFEIDNNFDKMAVQTRIKIKNVHEGDTVKLWFMSSESLCRGPYGFFVTNVTLTMCDPIDDDDISAAPLSSVLSKIAVALVFLVVAALIAQN